MSQEARTVRGRNLYIAGWILVPILILGGILLVLLKGGISGGPKDQPEQTRTKEEENYLSQVRSTLARPTDLAITRTVVQQLNFHLQKAKDSPAPTLTTSDSEKLKELLGLDKEGLAELTSPGFTTLDAHHLDACFLMRDAARSLEIFPMTSGGKTIRQLPLERASIGFAWVVRQIRLPAPDRPPIYDPPAPTVPVLRKGEGTPLERALVFLALLEQFSLEEEEGSGLQGCLVLLPDDMGQQRLWVCGVLVGSKADQVYLFDPRLGLPVPGPGGKGVATLKQAQSDPAVLQQLKVDHLTYDVTIDLAKKATLALVCPLSAVSARMQFLQDRLLRDRTWQDQALPSQVRVRLAENPLQTLEALKTAAGKPVVASIWKPGTTILRRFLPREEGGSDLGETFEIRKLRGFTTDTDTRMARLPREKVFQLSAVPWGDFPPIFRDPDNFRFDMGLGQQLRSIFAGPFVRQLTDAGTARDMILRGRYSRAVPELVREQEQFTVMRRRLQEADDLRPGIMEWIQRATAAYADQIRAKGTADEPQATARVASLWKWKMGEPIETLIGGAMAGPRGAEAMYQLGLCRHEQASRLQERLELVAQGGLTLMSEQANARKTWIDAEGYWKEFLDAHPGRPGQASALRLRAESQMRLGQTEAARQSLQAPAIPMSDLEKLACLWLARQGKPN